MILSVAAMATITSTVARVGTRLRGMRVTINLYGNNGDDNLNGGTGNDDLSGGNGYDNLNGGNGNDELYGENNDDVLFGDAGWDDLYGGNGNDILEGDEGNDNLYGDNGNDVLIGDAGNDHLTGGLGSDILVGGPGWDTFHYNSRNESPDNSGRDIIVEFDGNGNMSGDMLDLSGVDANATAIGNQAFTLNQLSYNNMTGILTANIFNTVNDLQIQFVGNTSLDISAPTNDIIL